MLKNNNPDINIDELNARIIVHLDRYKSSSKRLAPDQPRSNSGSTYVQPVSTVQELLGLDDEMFVEQAYHLLLKRPPDPCGLIHYLELIRSGGEKVDIITSLINSTEGRANGHLFPAAKRYAVKARLSRLPILGRAFSLVFSVLTASPFRHHVNAQFNYFSTIKGEHSAKIYQLEQHINELVQYQLLQRKKFEARVDKLQNGIDMQQQAIAKLERQLEKITMSAS